MEHSTSSPYVKGVRDHFCSGETFDLYWESPGKILRTHPVPERLQDYYDSDNYASHSEGGGGLLGKVYRLVRAYQFHLKFAWVRKYTDRPSRALDVGAGTGEWLSFLKKKGWAIAGTEPSDSGRNRAASKGVDLAPSLLEIEGGGFGLITLWHVLEHVVDLSTMLKGLNELTREDAVLIVALPNFQSWDARHYGSFWAAWDVPRHIWHFSVDGIRELIEPFGFEFVGSRPLWLDAFYVAVLSEKYKFGRPRYFRALVNGIRSNLSAMATSESSSRVYVFRKRK